MFFILIVLTLATFTASLRTDRVLMLVDEPEHDYSLYLDALRHHGYKVTVKSAIASDLHIERYGEYLFDHIILMASRVKVFGGGLSSNDFIRFVNDERQRHGFLVAVDHEKIGPAIETLCEALGFEIGSKSEGKTLDYFHYFENPSNIVLNTTTSNLKMFNEMVNSSSNEIIFSQGTCIRFDSEKNPLIRTLLTAHSTTLFKSASVERLGSEIVLAAALQARNNARVTLFASKQMFKNKYFSTNRAFVMVASDYTFQNMGYLEVRSIEHRLLSSLDNERVGVTNSSFYIIKEEVEYCMDVVLRERDADGIVREKPFCATDMQFELIRLDPFIRQNMECKDGRFTHTMKLPDVYGVFKFVVDYDRAQYSTIYASTTVPVRPLRHDQYERFIGCAMPYYLTCLSIIVSTLILSFPMLYTKNSNNKDDQ